MGTCLETINGFREKCGILISLSHVRFTFSHVISSISLVFDFVLEIENKIQKSETPSIITLVVMHIFTDLYFACLTGEKRSAIDSPHMNF